MPGGILMHLSTQPLTAQFPDVGLLMLLFLYDWLLAEKSNASESQQGVRGSLNSRNLFLM